MPKNNICTMFCTLCGNEQPVYDSRKRKLPNKTIQNIWCFKCKKVTPHKNILIYEKDLQENKKENISLDCSMIRGIKIPIKNRLFIKCTTADGFILEFNKVSEAIDFILLNELSASCNRNDLINSINNALKNKELLYGLKFRSVYVGINNGFCDEPEAFCKQKGAFLAKDDIVEHDCEQKQCQNFIKV